MRQKKMQFFLRDTKKSTAKVQKNRYKNGNFRQKQTAKITLSLQITENE